MKRKHPVLDCKEKVLNTLHKSFFFFYTLKQAELSVEAACSITGFVHVNKQACAHHNMCNVSIMYK